jgi:hypothetical protein
MGNDRELKKDLKACFRKFPTPNQHARNPFTNFTREISPFNVVKDVIDHIMGDFWGIKLFSVKKNPDGNMTLKHVMTIKQKLTSFANNNLMRIFFRLPTNYDFKIDLEDRKHKKYQNEYKIHLQRKHENVDLSNAQVSLVNNRASLFNHLKEIIAEINEIEGDKTITYTEGVKTVGGDSIQTETFTNITDKEVQKEKEKARQGKQAEKAAH